MAAGLYTKGREGFLDGSIDWDTDDIKVALTDETDDTPVPATDENYDDISTGTITDGLSANLTDTTVTGGVADAGNVTFSSVTAGDAADSFSGFSDSGTPATSRLIWYDNAATGLPVTPNGGDITITWADSGLDGSGGIFKL
jgi:hypothetical protein